ncbi:MAG: S9 family peptidase, partial [Hyphomicrobiales bacterium]|nr:S9 family peptidase [Hyphomicrobiales bacterium]
MSTPPIAEKRPVEDTHHGITRADDYAWLRADNWQEVMQKPDTLSSEIRSYLEAENAYTADLMGDTEALQETLFEEMKGRIKEDDISVPAPDGPFAYGIKFVTGAQHPMLIRTKRQGGDEQLLLDGNKEAEGKDYFQFGGTSHSPCHKLLAWAHDDKGSEYHKLQFRDVATGKDLEDVILNTSGGCVWSADSRHVFYVRLDDNHRPSKLYRHELDTPSSEDVLVHEEKDPGFFMGVGQTQSQRFILIDCHDHETSEVWLIPADDPTAEPVIVAPRENGVEYSVDEAHGTLYILTNADDTEDFKIVTAPVDNPGRDNWQDLIPQTPDTLILSHTVLAGHLIRLERSAGLPRIVIRKLDGGGEHPIAFEEE